MEESILKSVKQLLGINLDDNAFDLDILTHINSSFATLHQLGVGPEETFEIEDETKAWSDFLGEDISLNSVRSFVVLDVRMMFDPPSTSFALDAMNKRLEEFKWRLNVAADTSPIPVIPPPVTLDDDDDVIFDGGTP